MLVLLPARHNLCVCNTPASIQAKCADLDSRLLVLSNGKQALQQKVNALLLNADKLNPKKKSVAKEIVRWVHHNFLLLIGLHYIEIEFQGVAKLALITL